MTHGLNRLQSNPRKRSVVAPKRVSVSVSNSIAPCEIKEVRDDTIESISGEQGSLLFELLQSIPGSRSAAGSQHLVEHRLLTRQLGYEEKFNEVQHANRFYRDSGNGADGE